MSVQQATTSPAATVVVVSQAEVVGEPPGQRPQLHRFTVEQYHRLIESGILTQNDRVQLIDGWIIEMPPIGPSHATSTAMVDALVRRALPSGWCVRSQLPITLEGSEPEPDVAVARGALRDYARHHPAPADLSLVIEVSDTTLELDRQLARSYAAAGIAHYWIVNLVDRQLEVHRDPQVAATGAEYRSREVLGALGSVGLVIDGNQVATLKVADFLP